MITNKYFVVVELYINNELHLYFQKRAFFQPSLYPFRTTVRICIAEPRGLQLIFHKFRLRRNISYIPKYIAEKSGNSQLNLEDFLSLYRKHYVLLRAIESC